MANSPKEFDKTGMNIFGGPLPNMFKQVRSVF